VIHRVASALSDSPGMPHGEGALNFPDGSKYVGEMKDGRVTGTGRYVRADGEVLEGTFLNGALHGFGEFFNK
jgi:hypothetical protein